MRPPARLQAVVEQADQARLVHGMPARADTELAEQVLQVPLDGFVAHVQGQADLLVGHVVDQQTQDFALLGRQQGAGGDPRRRRPRRRRVRGVRVRGAGGRGAQSASSGWVSTTTRARP